MRHAELEELCREADRLQVPVLHRRGGATRPLRWDPPVRTPTGFGTLDRQVRVPSDPGGRASVLAVPYQPSAVGDLDEATLRLFRMDQGTRRRRVMTLTERHADLRVLFALVEPGTTYGVVGRPTDPRVRATIDVLCLLRSVAPDLDRNRLRNRICELVLCVPEFDDRIPGPDTRPLPNQPCERCRGIDLDDLLECELGAELDPQPACPPPPWESVGPTTIAGAIRQLVIDPNDRRRLYAVSASGGVWRLEDVDQYPTHATWQPLTDQLAHPRFRCMAIAPGHPHVLYAANVVKRLQARPATTLAVFSEIWRSRDAGSTWQPIHQDGLGVVHRLTVDPQNPERLWVATSSGLWERSSGAWKHRTGGHFTDVAVDPEDPDIVYAGSLRSDVPRINDGVFRSIGGLVWPGTPVLRRNQTLDGGLPVTRIALGVRNSDESMQTATTRTVVGRFGHHLRIRTGNFESAPIVPGGAALDQLDGGRTKRSDLEPALDHEWINCLAVDPFNPAHVIAGGVGLIETRDGGATWTVVAGDPPHEDYHAVVFDPEVRDLVYACNDGGVFSSVDGGRTWPTMAGSDITADTGRPRNLARGLVTAEIRSAALSGQRSVAAIDHTGLVVADSPPDWELWSRHQSGGGTSGALENALLVRCPVRDDRYYVCRPDQGFRLFETLVEAPGGVLDRFVSREITGAVLHLPDFPDPPYLPEALLFLCPRRAPLAVRRAPAPSNERLCVIGAPAAGGRFRLRTFRLPRDTPDAGITPVMTDVFGHGSPFVDVLFQPGDPDRLFGIAADGVLVEADVAGLAGTARNVDRWEYPPTDRAPVRLVAASGPRAVLFAISPGAVGRWQDGKGWRTQAVWSDPDEPLLSLVVHPDSARLLFLGTTRGVYVSTNAGVTWIRFGHGLPIVPVTELTVTDGELRAATFGRGLWRLRPLDR